MTLKKLYDIAIIGAGPAGIMAAIFAARKGKSVIILEKNPQIGRKILATGNGRCNLTNRNITIDHYHSIDLEFVGQILEQFDQAQTMQFFESLGLILKEEDRGRIFPRTNQASSVVEVLMQELVKCRVDLATDFTVKNIAKKTTWQIVSIDGQAISSHKLIIATGGKAAHHFGSSGDGLFWSQKLGHTISPIYAALVPIETVEDWPREVQGIKVEANVKVMVDNKIISQKTGDFLFTHYGVSGPAIMSQSGLIAPLLEKQSIHLSIDIMPELDKTALDKKLSVIFSNAGGKEVKNALVGVAPLRVLPIILRNSNISPEKKAAEISKDERKEIIENIKNMHLTVKKIRPLKEAQVSSGGILLSEVNSKTLESRILPALYFAGEILDVYGDSGGFNLQWAWSSGYTAGIHSAIG